MSVVEVQRVAGTPGNVEIALPLAQKAAQLFTDRGIENPRLEAELLLAHVLGLKRLDLYLQYDRPLTESQLEEFRVLVRRRLKREPLQYITGHVQFRELDLAVDARVLIPRPETEVLAGIAISFAHQRAEPLRAIDLGTGSGAIALSLAQECSNLSVLATDVSEDAIALARSNAQTHDLGVQFATASLWQAVDDAARFDIVVSNPPYVMESERATLQPEVRDWEPATALFGGDDGLDVVRELVVGAAAHMNEGALLAIEIGMTQAASAVAIVEATSAFTSLEVRKDLSGRDRIITAIRRREA